MKTVIVTATLVAGGLFLAACGPKTAPITDSADGSLSNSDGGVTYGLTLNGAALTAEGALIGGTDHGTPYIAGSGVYDGTYEVAYRHAGDTEISTDSGAISLVADFDTASLSGAAGDLTISGVISGVTLSGDVTYDGMAGTLTGGVIGANLAAGYFSGISGGDGFAGGFLTIPATP